VKLSLRTNIAPQGLSVIRRKSCAQGLVGQSLFYTNGDGHRRWFFPTVWKSVAKGNSSLTVCGLPPWKTLIVAPYTLLLHVASLIFESSPYCRLHMQCPNVWSTPLLALFILCTFVISKRAKNWSWAAKCGTYSLHTI